MRTLLLLAASGLLLAGCASSPQAEATAEDGFVEESYRVITTAHTPLYQYGPAQANGADLLLAKDDLVTLVKQESGFSRVRTESDVVGYVANDRLADAPPDRFPIALMPPAFRTDTSSEPEWLDVVSVDDMLTEPPLPPLEELTPPEPVAPAAPAAPAASPTPTAPAEQPPTPDSDSNG